MGGQYFERRPASARRPARITVTIRGRPFLFQTDSGVFSREGLDRGTELLLEAIEVGPCESILDLGCGYGVIGIVAAHLSEGGHVILTDVNERAAALARANLAGNGIRNAEVRIGTSTRRSTAWSSITSSAILRSGRAAQSWIGSFRKPRPICSTAEASGSSPAPDKGPTRFGSG